MAIKPRNKPMEFIDLVATNGFKVGDKEYFLEPHVSLDRYKMMLKLELEIGYQTNFSKHFKSLEKLAESLNKLQLMDSCVQLRDIMDSVRRLDDKHDEMPVIKYCALIFNTKDEDRNAVDEQLMTEKIKDFKASGISASSFFAVVLRSVNGLLQIYRANTQDTSAKD